MSAKIVAAFLCGAVAAGTGTAAAFTTGHVFRLQQGDEARYGNVQCQAVNVPPYAGFDCLRVPHWEVVYSPSEIRVLRTRVVNRKVVSRSVFHVDPSGG
jgi:hypothetical protein